MHPLPRLYAQFFGNRGELRVNGVEVQRLRAVVVLEDVLEEPRHVDGGSRGTVGRVVERDGEGSEAVLGEELDLVEEQIAEAETIDVVLHGDVLLGDQVADRLVHVHALRVRKRERRRGVRSRRRRGSRGW